MFRVGSGVASLWGVNWVQRGKIYLCVRCKKYNLGSDGLPMAAGRVSGLTGITMERKKERERERNFTIVESLELRIDETSRM